MQKSTMNYHRLATRRYRKAAWIQGTGPYASLAYCDVLTVMLYDSREDAERGKAFIDRYGCGHACQGDQGHADFHVIVDLSGNA